MTPRAPRRDVLLNPESVGGLLLSGALAGALAAGPLLAWRLGTVLATEREPEGGAPVAGAAQGSGSLEPPLPSPDAPTSGDPRLRFPVQAADRTRMRASFDDGRAGGRRHRALDIFAPRHSPVRAVDAGLVLRLSRGGAGGVAVEQADPTGRYCYYYAHLDRYAAGLHAGQSVGSGQTIGYVGSSGNAPRKSPHLHLGVFRSPEGKTFDANVGCWSGTAVDPYPLLRDEGP